MDAHVKNLCYSQTLDALLLKGIEQAIIERVNMTEQQLSAPEKCFSWQSLKGCLRDIGNAAIKPNVTLMTYICDGTHYLPIIRSGQRVSVSIISDFTAIIQ